MYLVLIIIVVNLQDCVSKYLYHGEYCSSAVHIPGLYYEGVHTHPAFQHLHL